MDVKILSLEDTLEWNRYLRQLPKEQQDIYYSPEYYTSFEHYGDGKALCFVYEQKGNLLLYPFLKNSINQLGYNLDENYFDIQGVYGYNGLISSTAERDFINEFYVEFNNFCRTENIIAEFIRFNPYLDNIKLSKQHVDEFLNRRTVLLNLERPYDEIWNNSYTSKNRNKIRKARKSGYKIEIDNSLDGVKDFYSIYQQTMSRIGAESYYFFNIEMFKELLDYSQYNFLFVKNEEGQSLASMILMIYGNYAHYHLSGRHNNANDSSLNNFMLDEAIKIAIEKNARLFHFGGGTSLDSDNPLFRFKASFSKEFSDFYIGKKIHNQTAYYQLIGLWKSNYPESYTKHKKILLGYRCI